MINNKIMSFIAGLRDNRLPGQLVIQLTDRCNAQCPQCGMRAAERFKRSTLAMDTVKRTLDAARQKGIQAVSFTGGEPLLLLGPLVELISHAGAAGFTHIRTGTNGFIFKDSDPLRRRARICRLAEALAETPLRNFWISIDSSRPYLHEQMRGFKGMIQGIQQALPIFHDHGIFPSANLGLNRNMGGLRRRQRLAAAKNSGTYLDLFEAEFKAALDEFYRFIIDLGFTMASVCYPMSVEEGSDDSRLEPVYEASAVDPVIRFSRQEKVRLFQSLLETVPRSRSRIRLFTPLCSVYALGRQHSRTAPSDHACRGGIDYFFIDARDGNTYPCGYRGNENMGKFWNLNMETIDRQKECRLCDWECFRDPSEMFGPLLNATRDLPGLLGHMLQDRTFYRYWMADLAYYRMCDLFDGRKPPQYNLLNTIDPLLSSPAQHRLATAC